MALATVLAGVASAEELILLTWAEYLAPELIDEFEEESGATLKIVVFELDEARDSLLFTNGPAAYDLMVMGGSSIAGYVRRGWLAPIEKAGMPNLVHLKPLWVSAHDQSEAYGVPYVWERPASPIGATWSRSPSTAGGNCCNPQSICAAASP